jgi:transitional endoplasmic reticulum ATPase
MRESMQAAVVTTAHLELALKAVHPSLDPAQVTALQAFADRREQA